MGRKNPKKLLKFLLKITITFWALYYVLGHIERDKLLQTLRVANIWWLLLAFVVFNASKVASSVRLNYYFGAIGILVSYQKNLLLYYIGMFYNLFLPSGIGGDGYKAYLLQKKYQRGYKLIVSALLLDRISGAVALLFFAGILFVRSDFATIFPLLQWAAILGVLLSIPLYYLLNRLMFVQFLSVFNPTTIYGFIVQALQLLSALCIVWALSIESVNIVNYLTLFLISSLVAILPVSIGGVGVRELTFLYGFALIGADTTTAVTFSLLFFLITALSSLLGAMMRVEL